MQVTAAGVDAEGPGGESGGLPGGESERMVEKVRYGRERDGFGRRKRVEETRVEKRVIVIVGGLLERNKRSRDVTAKGIRLIRPVQTSRTSSVTLEGVLRPVVVLYNQLKRRRRRRRRRREGHGTCCVRD